MTAFARNGNPFVLMTHGQQARDTQSSACTNQPDGGIYGGLTAANLAFVFRRQVRQSQRQSGEIVEQ